MFKSLHSARNRLRPVWITFGILSVSNTLKVPLQVFDIVQFSRSCSLRPLGRRPTYFITSGPVCQALFSSFFKWFWSALISRTLAEVRSAGRLSIILQSPTSVKPFFQVFYSFFGVYDSSPKSCGFFGKCSENTIYCVKVLDLPLNDGIIVLLIYILY